jgi:hypothetical protein
MRGSALAGITAVVAFAFTPFAGIVPGNMPGTVDRELIPLYARPPTPEAGLGPGGQSPTLFFFLSD